MIRHKMIRDKLEPKRYEYLSKSESDLYDVATSLTKESLVLHVRLLLEKIAEMSRGDHRASTY